MDTDSGTSFNTVYVTTAMRTAYAVIGMSTPGNGYFRRRAQNATERDNLHAGYALLGRRRDAVTILEHIAA